MSAVNTDSCGRNVEMENAGNLNVYTICVSFLLIIGRFVFSMPVSVRSVCLRSYQGSRKHHSFPVSVLSLASHCELMSHSCRLCVAD